jgi:hypothetical protein
MQLPTSLFLPRHAHKCLPLEKLSHIGRLLGAGGVPYTLLQGVVYPQTSGHSKSSDAAQVSTPTIKRQIPRGSHHERHALYICRLLRRRSGVQSPKLYGWETHPHHPRCVSRIAVACICICIYMYKHIPTQAAINSLDPPPQDFRHT